jgi:hypothetical protein
MTKTDAESAQEQPTEEPASPASDESPEGSNDRDLDELRRFRVRTVPPDMRRQWILAEPPVVSTLELQDTVPPNARPSSAPPEPVVTPPRPFFSTPRVSSTAATRRLPRVVPRSERAMTVVATAVGLLLAAVLLGLVWKESKRAGISPQTSMSQAGNQPAAELARQVEQDPSVPRDPVVSRPAAVFPPVATPVNSAAGIHSAPIPSAKARGSQTEQIVKLPASAQSGKIPPAPKPRPESDIKSPLFGQ